jgi:hypothetical protein
MGIIIMPSIFSQKYISADPYYLLNYEFKQFNKDLKYHSTAMRPFYNSKNKFISIKIRNETYLNNNASNQENMDVRFIGEGLGSYTSIFISGYSKFIAFNFEPYSLTNNYKDSKVYNRDNPYKFLNDSKTHKNLKSVGLRKADIFIHYNGLGVGLSNDNMWWGPGFQGSISMTNNTVGFKNFMIGTIRELRWRKIGIMGRYTFSDLNEKSGWEATYFTALTGQVTFYSEQIITIGLSRNYLTGGLDLGVPWEREDAQKVIFEDIFIKNLTKLDYTLAGHDPWDQTMGGWVEIAFPKNKLKIYLEIGFNDNRFNFWDFVVQPDHAMGSIIGFRKYGLFNNKNLIFGFEYINLIKGRHHIFRASPDWYDRKHYDDFSFEGRRWGAHSGSDSDDLSIYFGYMNENFTIIPTFNFERHGVTSYRPAEIKSEFKIDTRFNFNKFELGLFYESQFEAHLGFPPDQYFIDEVTGKRRTNTFIVRLSKNLGL